MFLTLYHSSEFFKTPTGKHCNPRTTSKDESVAVLAKQLRIFVSTDFITIYSTHGYTRITYNVCLKKNKILSERTNNIKVNLRETVCDSAELARDSVNEI